MGERLFCKQRVIGRCACLWHRSRSLPPISARSQKDRQRISNPSYAGRFACLWHRFLPSGPVLGVYSSTALGRTVNPLPSTRLGWFDSNNTHQLLRNHGRRRVWTQPALKAVATGNGEGSIPSSSAINSSTNREAAGVATWLSTSRDGFNSRAVYQFCRNAPICV